MGHGLMHCSGTTPSCVVLTMITMLIRRRTSRYEVIGKIGEGTYGVVYLARSRGARSRLLAVKTFKPGKVRPVRQVQLKQHWSMLLSTVL